MNRVLDKGAVRQDAAVRIGGANHARPAGSAGSLVLPKSHVGDRFWFFSALILIDIAAISAGFIGAGAIRLGTPFAWQGIKTLAIILPIFLAIALNNRAYSLEALERPSYGIRRIVQAFVYACAVGIAFLFYLKVSEQFSRVVFAVGTVLSLASMASARWLLGNFLGSRYRWTFRNRLVIVDEIDVTPHPGDCIVFAEHLGVVPGSDDPVMRHRLGEMLGRFDSVVLACPPERRRQWTYSLHGAAVDVELLMPELSRLGAVELRTSHGEKTLVVSSRPMGLIDRLTKRVLDLIVASLALVIVAPLMLVLALAVRLESPGPIFFVQPRVGQNNRMFQMLKFRSMRSESSDHEGNRSASPSDDRVTPLGRFMRRTSLDELPQLLNVLKGDMSIVGPRPHALGSTAEESLFWQIDRRYFQRHAIKPGITGLAQVRGYRGATDRRHDLTNRLQSDLEYVSGWTIWRDLKIIAGTFLVLVHPRAF
jgi:lipopolysaccharide/colanic/teichoic acid biosynthesis glycosyltransferase